jgi:hypothetical protein
MFEPQEVFEGRPGGTRRICLKQKWPWVVDAAGQCGANQKAARQRHAVLRQAEKAREDGKPKKGHLGLIPFSPSSRVIPNRRSSFR